ncbi:MAG: hypothetical protein EBU46_19065 [Nitrosomonadaceae bacterium]|nr:hypothetical protein [Nitrosomonadaceae bacterium]
MRVYSMRVRPATGSAAAISSRHVARGPFPSTTTIVASAGASSWSRPTQRVYCVLRAGAPVTHTVTTKISIGYLPRRAAKLVSENDVIFCNPILWIAKNDIVFAYRQD